MVYYDLGAIPIILDRFKIKNIVISGLSNNNFIEMILNYCEENNVSYLAIDSQVDFENENNSIKGNSLSILPGLKNYDAIFINDDPNWYTVFNELKIIKETNDEFPLVFICHNKFPNKFRDSYINPENIPKEFLQEYSNDLPINHEGVNILIKDGFFHAVHEKTPKNGVLNAINDFLDNTKGIGLMDLELVDGTTILCSKDSIYQIRMGILEEDLKNHVLDYTVFSDRILENRLLINYIDKFDFSNENFEDISEFRSKLIEKENIIKDFENTIKIHNNEMAYKNSKLDGITTELNLKDYEIINYESKLLNNENELKKANNEINFLKSNLNKIESEYGNLEAMLESTNSNLKLKSTQLDEKESDLISLKKRYTVQLSKLDNKEYCISCFKEEIENNHSEIQYLKSNNLIRKLFRPLGYIYLILKSKPQEISTNIKLYKAINNSKCFDIGYYLNKNKDIQNSKWCRYFSLELHYVCHGFNEHRNFNKKYFNRNSKEELLNYLSLCEK